MGGVYAVVVVVDIMPTIACGMQSAMTHMEEEKEEKKLCWIEQTCRWP